MPRKYSLKRTSRKKRYTRKQKGGECSATNPYRDPASCNIIGLNKEECKSSTIIKKAYMYDKCLCYQPFTETANSKLWGYEFGDIGIFASVIIQNILKVFKLNTDPKYGFNKAYKNCVKLPII